MPTTREAVNAKRLADPEYDAKYLAKRRAQKARARARKKTLRPPKTHCRRGLHPWIEGQRQCLPCKQMKGFVWSSLQHGPAGHKVYALVDSRGPEVFYVGCSYNLYQRMHDHRAGNTTNLAMKLRAADIKASGATMDMVILERTEDLAREQAWIDFFRPYGLMNSIEHQSPARPTKRALPLAA